MTLKRRHCSAREFCILKTPSGKLLPPHLELKKKLKLINLIQKIPPIQRSLSRVVSQITDLLCGWQAQGDNICESKYVIGVVSI